MTSKSLARFSAAAAKQRVELFSITVLFRGEAVRIPRPTMDPTLSLEVGGYRETAGFRLRFPASVTPPPRAKEVILEMAAGQKYVVVTCVPAAGDASHAHEHIVEARRG